jgi:arylsulfatase A-like enzyme
VVDRLGANFLGPYGNTWVGTPELNRLASQSFLFEYALSDTPDINLVYRSYWQGLHAMCPAGSAAPQSLPVRLAAHAVNTVLLTDESRIASHVLTADFCQPIELSTSRTTRAAREVDRTQTARLFAASIERLQQLTPPFLLWIHAQAMSGPWDAPLAFRNRFADEDDPAPPNFVTPPSYRLEEDYDPDELLGVSHAYAGQVVLIDICLGALLDAVMESKWGKSTLLAFVSPRGFPLGEHKRLGAYDEALYSELLHTPFMLRLPNQAGATCRSHALVQPPDLYATLLSWFGVEADETVFWRRSLLRNVLEDNENVYIRDRACCCLGHQRAIRTPAWFLRVDGTRHELFAKPDDRWEVNEVTSRCEPVAAKLLEALDEFHQAAQSVQAAELPHLPSMLTEGLE